MKHIHHIVPKHMGGSDDPTNLISLTVEEHADAHKTLYETYGKIEDYIAWKGLDGSIGKEELISIKCSIGGKKATETLKKLKICSFHNESLRAKAAEKGRESVKKMRKGFYDSSIQSKLGKLGGPKNIGFVWLTDKAINMKYTRKMQKQKSIEDFIKENPNFKIGRSEKTEIVCCPHCNKSGNSSAFKGHHFDNCYMMKDKTWKMKTTKTCLHCGKIGSGGAMIRFHFENCKKRNEK